MTYNRGGRGRRPHANKKKRRGGGGEGGYQPVVGAKLGPNVFESGSEVTSFVFHSFFFFLLACHDFAPPPPLLRILGYVTDHICDTRCSLQKLSYTWYKMNQCQLAKKLHMVLKHWDLVLAILFGLQCVLRFWIYTFWYGSGTSLHMVVVPFINEHQVCYTLARSLVILPTSFTALRQYSLHSWFKRSEEHFIGSGPCCTVADPVGGATTGRVPPLNFDQLSSFFLLFFIFIIRMLPNMAQIA